VAALSPLFLQFAGSMKNRKKQSLEFFPLALSRSHSYHCYHWNR
jgi:hypothetical protein